MLFFYGYLLNIVKVLSLRRKKIGSVIGHNSWSYIILRGQAGWENKREMLRKSKPLPERMKKLFLPGQEASASIRYVEPVGGSSTDPFQGLPISDIRSKSHFTSKRTKSVQLKSKLTRLFAGLSFTTLRNVPPVVKISTDIPWKGLLAASQSPASFDLKQNPISYPGTFLPTPPCT